MFQLNLPRLAQNHTVIVKVIPLNGESQQNVCKQFENFVIVSRQEFLAFNNISSTFNWGKHLQTFLKIYCCVAIT